MSVYRLPTEIWRHIISSVPQHAQPNLLQVSRMFHAIAIDLVFQAVKVYIIGGEKASAMLYTVYDDWRDETSEKLMKRSYGVLQRIVSDQAFARAVKSMTVITAMDGQGIFETLLIADAVKALTNLQTFRWLGTSPGLTDAVTESLPSTLQRLVLKTYVPSVELMQRFGRLVEVAFPTPFYYPDDLESQDESIASSALLEITATIDFKGVTNAISLDNLRSMTLNAEHLGALPLKVLETLRELDICVTTGIQAIGLDLVLRHAHVLESLTLFGYIDQEVFSWLTCEASALPALTSFRLSIDRFSMPHPPSDPHLDMLNRFLEDRVNLRRLFLRIPTIRVFGLYQVAPVIRNMKKLEVLGFHTGSTIIDDGLLPFIQTLIPANAKALFFALDWNGSVLLPLIDQLSGYPNLSFFSMYGATGQLALEREDVATTAPNVQLFGRGRFIWDVVRGGPEVEFKKWPRWKSKFCVEEDFEDEDHYWLYKYN